MSEICGECCCALVVVDVVVAWNECMHSTSHSPSLVCLCANSMCVCMYASFCYRTLVAAAAVSMHALVARSVASTSKNSAQTVESTDTKAVAMKATSAIQSQSWAKPSHPERIHAGIKQLVLLQICCRGKLSEFLAVCCINLLQLANWLRESLLSCNPKPTCIWLGCRLELICAIARPMQALCFFVRFLWRDSARNHHNDQYNLNEDLACCV